MDTSSPSGLLSQPICTDRHLATPALRRSVQLTLGHAESGLQRSLLVFVALELALGFANAYAKHPTEPSVVAFLALWSALPTSAGWALLALIKLHTGQPRQLTHLRAVLTATFAISSLWVLGLLLGAVRGPPPATGAGHMGHFLWPPLLCVAGALIYGTASVVLLVAQRDRREA